MNPGIFWKYILCSAKMWDKIERCEKTISNSVVTTLLLSYENEISGRRRKANDNNLSLFSPITWLLVGSNKDHFRSYTSIVYGLFKSYGVASVSYLATAVKARSTLTPVLALVSMKGTEYSWTHKESTTH